LESFGLGFPIARYAISLNCETCPQKSIGQLTALPAFMEINGAESGACRPGRAIALAAWQRDFGHEFSAFGLAADSLFPNRYGTRWQKLFVCATGGCLGQGLKSCLDMVTPSSRKNRRALPVIDCKRIEAMLQLLEPGKCYPNS
jgi:hypothetical protein